MGSRQAPTERDLFWLDHENVLATSGLSAKAYAAEHELSLHALYQARKRLKALGHLPKGQTRSDSKRTRARTEPVSFSKIEVSAPRATPPEFRLSLPNGLMLEWSGSELPEPVVHLVERLTQPR